ncbi:CLUMA_CG006302, isoform A [Clunio marinus]|uniref:CLUMA_CG006302, isoform A n=1 Tax=Clunio marinus TaxID=568069 RepID=A0A1J1I3A9_9DIPT|nr:CLUMA_CG006302, isoform A [Clunio marinus]
MNMRQQRITTSQQEVYLIYLMEHTEFAASRIKDGESKYDENWKELTKMLNNTLGPKKSVDEWKMVFFNWKNQLRTRAKKLKQIQDGKTGADDKLALQKLTAVEKRALKLWKEDFQDKDIASILNEIENKDITITPISKQQNVNLKKRKASDSIIITSNTQLAPPSSTPTSVVSVPITITRTKDDQQQVDELINIKLEPFEELLTSNTQLRSSADITVQEILDWAKTFKIPQSAVNELLQILKIKRIKTEIKSESPTKVSTDGTTTSSLQQQSVGLFSKIFQRLEGMERNLMNRMTTLERKVDMKNLQQLKIQSPNQHSPQPK